MIAEANAINTESSIVDFVEANLGDSHLLGRFFNTLSYLEHLGSRKILGCNIGFRNRQLQHAAEETRHALRFKRLALHYSSDCDSYDSPVVHARASAHAYFQRLDAAVRIFLRNLGVYSPAAAYVLVTYLVEKRAESLYPALLRIMPEGKATVTLSSIVREEDRHLREMEEDMRTLHNFSSTDLEHLTSVESDLFARLVSRMIGS